MTLDWERLLCVQRLHRDASGEVALYHRQEEGIRTPGEADVQRIVFSAPFRRLAGKTQVHPFAQVDTVHNRLTHSLEVAETGAALARAVSRGLSLSTAQQRACTEHVRAACLGHDMGCPPYGHVGETMLQTWVRDNQAELQAFLADEGAETLVEDFLSFDGNAQTFRLLARPDPLPSAHFRLTCATLGAMVKYPWTVLDAQTKKFSCFTAMRPCFALVMQALGLEEGAHGWQRHPLSYLTEIADDICYCVTDCEDACLMGILDERTVCEWYLNLFSPEGRGRRFGAETVSNLRAQVIGDLIHGFEEELIEAFREPARLAEFETHSPTWQRLKRLKADYSVVFEDAHKRQKEAAARKAYHYVLDNAFAEVKALQQQGSCIQDSERVRLLFGKEILQAQHPQTARAWLHFMFDAMTGLTDDAVRQVATALKNVSPPEPGQ